MNNFRAEKSVDTVDSRNIGDQGLAFLSVSEQGMKSSSEKAVSLGWLPVWCDVFAISLCFLRGKGKSVPMKHTTKTGFQNLHFTEWTFFNFFFFFSFSPKESEITLHVINTIQRCLCFASSVPHFLTFSRMSWLAICPAKIYRSTNA